MESMKEFQNWFESEYCAKIDFYGDSIKTPMMHGRSQGKSVALCANVGWSAWQEASKRSEILIAQRDELLETLKMAKTELEWWVSEHACCDGHETGCMKSIDEAIANCEVKS